MGFLLSKLLPLLVYPLGAGLLLLGVGLLGRRRRWGPGLSATGLALMWLASMPWLNRQLVWSLEEQAVRDFADGRVFTGAQALELGLVDALGDEEAARRLAAQLAGLDAERCRSVTLGRPQRRLGRLLPGGRLLASLQEILQLELAGSGQPLWLHRS